jgi:hypothetical protein
LVVLGAVAVLIARFSVGTNKRVEQLESPLILQAADQALAGFAAANFRLPCPDMNADGIEDCGASGALNSIGSLPSVTLGLARSDVKQVRYGVFRQTAAPSNDLAVASDRFFPLLVVAIPSAPDMSPVAAPAQLGASNGLDFCHAVRRGAALPSGTSTDETALHIRAPNTTLANSAAIKNVAYALSLPNVDSDTATNLNTMPFSFASPNQPLTASYRDTVLAVDFAQFFDRLSCGGILAAASHAHPNIASGAAIIRGAMLDYDKQLGYQIEVAEIAQLDAIGGVTSAAGGVASAVADTLSAISESMVTKGGLAASIALAAVATALAAGGVVTAALGVVSADKSVADAKQTRVDFQALITDSKVLAESLLDNAKSADLAGIYGKK